MNNGFAINFLRFVREEGDNSWSQVFARLPFDEVELNQKGSLFGVVYNKEKENWADTEVEMTNWVEEYFNGVEKGGDLADFFVKFSEKYGGVECLWLWIVREGGVRKMKVISRGETSLTITRDGSLIDLSKNLKTEKVILGELKTGDEIRLWVGSLTGDIETWESEANKSDGESFAAFKIEVKETKAAEKPEEVEIDIEKEKLVETVTEAEKVTEEVRDEAQKSEEVKVFERESLASRERVVGPVGPFLRFKNWLVERKRLRVSTEPLVKNKKKLSVLFGGIFLGLLIVSLVLGGARKKSLEAEKQWVEFSQPIEKSLSDALGLTKINPAGSKKLVEDARIAYNLKKADFVDESYGDKVSNLGKKIDEVWATVSGEKNGEVTEVVNLELIRAGVNANKMSLVKDKKFVVTSTSSGLTMSVDTAQKEVKVVAGKGAGLGWLDSASDGSKYFVMNKGGVFIVGNETNSLVFDTAVTDPLSLASFGTNIYVLEKGNKEIFKFLVNESGFGERTRWLKENQTMSVTPMDMDIDVDIWVLGEKGQVERFRRGAKEVFSLSGLPGDVEFEKISVEDTGDRIALLSMKSGTVAFCSKTDGVCGQQIKTDKLKEAKDMDFDGENKLMILFPGSIGVLN